MSPAQTDRPDGLASYNIGETMRLSTNQAIGAVTQLREALIGNPGENLQVTRTS